VSNINIELEERTNDVSRLEDMLAKVRSEFSQQQSTVLANVPKSNVAGEKALSLSAVPLLTANVAEMELRIERLERELGTSKRQIDAAKIELEEREKASERIRGDMEKLRLEKNARVEELENTIEEKNQNLSKIRLELDVSKQSIEHMKDQLKGVQSELAEAIQAANRAEDANQTATNAFEKSKAAEQAANHTCEKLKTQVELLQKVSDVYSV
jgi:chromosome segregation ATPase